MEIDAPTDLIERLYHKVHGAEVTSSFEQFLSGPPGQASTAILGYRRANQGRLFLEQYLDVEIEVAVQRAMGIAVARADIVELGNFASVSGLAMIDLWAQAANDLGSGSQVAVATLTAPLRAMFARIGLPLVVLAPATRSALGDEGQCWGSYYDKDPQVCAGLIVEGQAAIQRHFARRNVRRAA